MAEILLKQNHKTDAKDGDEKFESVTMDRLLNSIRNVTKKLESIPDRRVLLIYTGGTIGMVRSDQGYVPKKSYLEKLMRTHRSLCDNEFTHFHAKDGFIISPLSIYNKRTYYKILEFDPLIDSSNMNYGNWQAILRAVEEHYEKYDAFIVIHGTDTMAYTASFLSFALENLQKTVIITGAQVPLCEVRNDASSNLLGALMIAGHFTIPEVCIFFRDKLFRGCRSTKMSSHDLDAFDSPHYEPLASFGIDLKINWNSISKFSQQNEKLVVQKNYSQNIGFLKISPLLTPEFVKSVFNSPGIQAVVIECYGSGNIPGNRDDIIECIEEATSKGVIVATLTQCFKGSASVKSAYEVARRAEKAGVISGLDLTVEACITKLSYLLGKGLPLEEVRRLFQTNIRGELTAHEDAKDEIFCINQEDFILSMWNTIFDVTQSTQSLKQSLTPNLLCTACYYGYIDMLKNLYACHSEINEADYDDRTPLHIAARQGNVEIVQFMIDKGVNLNPMDKFGRCPLYEAIVNRQRDMIQLLHSHGAELRVGYDLLLNTLFNCVKENDLDTLKDFYYCGLKTMETYKNVDGRTIAHLAAQQGKLDFIDFLKEEVGFDFAVKDRWGKTPLDEAVNSNHQELAHTIQGGTFTL